MISIALDAMSGDNGLETTIFGSLDALDKYPDLEIILVGIKSEILTKFPKSHKRMRIQHATEVVEMDDLPSIALRNKKDSSMRVAVNLVKSGDAQAAVSAGNTGALMAMSRFVLKMQKGIDRPVLCTSVPTQQGSPVWILDLGANVDSSPDQLLQFGLMGSALVSTLLGRKPTVGLLNVGTEEIKGNETIKKASKLLEESHLDYRGYVEGDGIFEPKVDLVVCDGFAGNVVLKSIEGIAHLIQHFLKKEFTKNWMRKLSGLIAMPALMALKKSVDPRGYNGASLLGLRGLVVKSHGDTDRFGMCAAISVAYIEAKSNLVKRIEKEAGLTRVK